MEHSTIPNSGDYIAIASDPWVPILHLDIKPDNIMLLKANDDYPSYPKPVLGDFDLSCVNDGEFKKQFTNALGPRFAGTSGCLPPVSSICE
jgi:serine/threonine protein kinase